VEIEPLHPSLRLWVEILGTKTRSQFLTAVVHPQRGKKDREHMFQAPRQQHQRAIDIPPTACATRAAMPAFPQRFFDHRTAGMTPLGRLQGARRGLDIHDTSFCRFVSQDAKELCRGTVENRFVETGFGGRAIGDILPRRRVPFGLRTARHVGRLELFGQDRRRTVNHRRGLLMVKVQALPRHRAMQLRHALVGQTPPPRARLLAVSGLVRGCQLGCALPQKTRVGNRDRLALDTRDGGKRLDAPVKGDGLDTARTCRLTGQDNRGIPPPVAVRDVARFRLAHRPGIAAYPHMPDARQSQPAMLHPLARQEAPPIAMRGITPTGKPPPLAVRLEQALPFRR